MRSSPAVILRCRTDSTMPSTRPRSSLTMSTRQPPQRGHRERAAAEAVQRDAHAEPAQRVEPLLQLVQRDARVAVGQLQDQRSGLQLVQREQPLHGAGAQGAVREPARGKPYGHGCGESRRRAARPPAERPPPATVGSPRSLSRPVVLRGARGAVRARWCRPAGRTGAGTQELGRREEDALRGAPARLSGDGGDLAAGQLDDRLVEQRELALVQGAPQPRRRIGTLGSWTRRSPRPRPARAARPSASAARTARPAPCRACLARYIARSALRISAVGEMPGSAKAIPMEAATRTSVPSTR